MYNCKFCVLKNFCFNKKEIHRFRFLLVDIYQDFYGAFNLTNGVRRVLSIKNVTCDIIRKQFYLHCKNLFGATFFLGKNCFNYIKLFFDSNYRKDI